MHLADAFIQSDLHLHSGYTFFQYMCSLGIEPTTFALLTQCSTTEPQEHGSGAKNTIIHALFLNRVTYANSFI